MNIGKPHIVFTLLFVVFAGLLMPSCNDENEYILGENFIESSTKLSIVDTFTVEMSTVILDSVVTSGKGAMLIGNYLDTIFGNTSCSGFFQIGLPESISLDEHDIFDSVNLIIQYSKYSYGDTNSLMRLSVHQLKESIEPHENGNLYNVSSVDFDASPLGSVVFLPSPNSKNNTISITLKEAFGLDLFNKFVEGSEIVSDDISFLEYFKGIALLADETVNKTILGFNAVVGSPLIRLYTHRIEETQVENQYDFPMIQEDHQFNRMHYDFQNTPLQYVDNQSESIPSGITGNKAFVQGFQKIMTKVRFPSLPDFLLNERGVILKAELIFYPYEFSYIDFDLPEHVIFYETNHRNAPIGILSDPNGDPLTAVLVKDEIFHKETSYTIDITDFITKEFSDSYYDVEHGLLISLYDPAYQLNLERILIETKSPAPKLKTYYLTY